MASSLSQSPYVHRVISIIPQKSHTLKRMDKQWRYIKRYCSRMVIWLSCGMQNQQFLIGLQDLSDDQYNGFRSQFLMLLAIAVVWLSMSAFVKKKFCSETNRRPLVIFYMCSSLIFLLVLFQATIIFPVGAAMVSGLL